MIKMKNLTALLLLSLLTTLSGVSQITHSCPSDILNDSLLNNNTEFSRSFYYMERVLGMNSNLHPSQRTNDVYTIPVVVHVIHNGEAYGTGTNITNEQIYSAIEALNQDYRRMAGTNGFGNGVDVGVEFCLASRNPSGQPTNGIVRVNGSSVANYATMGIEASAGSGAVEENVKALSTWPRASYLNIWVVNEIENNDGGSGIQGYAYFPVNSPIDGIVVLYNAFGTVGNLKSYTNMNRTLTHEVGHYLGLYHTFNSTTSCTGETNCTTQGDRVCDTPPTIQAGSCSSPACSGTQQVQNYMDYTSQTCQDMFTDGQKLRMRTTLESQRTSILTSMGCMPVYQNDIGVTAIISPTGTSCAGGISPQVTLSNYGSNTLSTAQIQYNVDGVGTSTFNWSGSLASGASINVTLPSINPAAGAHTFYAWSASPNNGTDENAANNQSTGTFSVTSGAAAQLDVVLDYYGTETTWNITDANDAILMSGGPYVNGQQGLHNITPVCLAVGCYTLTMNDLYGDGQGFTSGSFSLTAANGSVLASGAGNWGDTSANDFCIVATTPQGQAPVASFTIQDNTICRNVQNDYTSTSTQSPTSYSWVFEGGSPATSTQQNPQNVTYAAAGTYDVTLTATNAFGTHTYVCTNCVTVYADPAVTLTSTNPGCGNQSNGAISSSVSGTGPYTYSWNNGSTSANLTAITAGSYTVNVTSAQGCAAQASATLTSAPAIAITGTVTNVLCSNAANGSITTSVTGGTGNKTYSWSNGSTTANISNLASGSYTVNVSDASGCAASGSFTVTAPSAITVTGNVTNVSCAGGNNGSIAVSAAGGTGNKTFTWSNGLTGNTLSNQPAGTYTVTATDANGCSASQAFTITAPTAVSISGTATNADCFGSNDGSISVQANGGNGALTISWSNGMTGSQINNLAPGNYSATAINAAGCNASASFTIAQPTEMAINLSDFDIACSNQVGSAFVNPTGGTAPYSASWSNSVSGTQNNNLNAGNYNVSVTDSHGCVATQSFVITQTENLSIELIAQNPTCFGINNGAVNALVQGGNGNYTFEWSNGSSASSISGLGAGQYSLTVTDGEGCNGTVATIVEQPAQMIATIDANDATCFGLNNGWANANIQGGTAPYSFSWSNGSNAELADNLSTGIVSVNVTDANGCIATATAEVEQPDMLTANVLITNQESCVGNDGSAEIMVTGGIPAYTILWSNGNEGAELNNAGAGLYEVLVSDANGCTIYTTAEIANNCVQTIPTTQLTTQFCNASELGLDAVVACEIVTGADQYMWRVTTTTGTILFNAYTPNNELNVGTVTGIDFSSTYIIGIKARVNGNWGSFGSSCSVTTESITLPVAGIQASDCGTTINGWDQSIHADEINDAVNYEWQIIGNGNTMNATTIEAAIAIDQSLDLIQGETYEIRVRCELSNGMFTDWSTYCSFTMGTVLPVNENSGSVFQFNLYPNPNNGSSVQIDWNDAANSDNNLTVTITDAAGKLISREVIDGGVAGKHTINFDNQLTAGFYMVTVETTTQRIEKKLLVN